MELFDIFIKNWLPGPDSKSQVWSEFQRHSSWKYPQRYPQLIPPSLARIDRLATGNPGDVKPVGQGISEMRIDYGPGYRLYFMQRDALVTVLLCGGDKRNAERRHQARRRDRNRLAGGGFYGPYSAKR